MAQVKNNYKKQWTLI